MGGWIVRQPGQSRLITRGLGSQTAASKSEYEQVIYK
jgi:hypothetical protein